MKLGTDEARSEAVWVTVFNRELSLVAAEVKEDAWLYDGADTPSGTLYRLRVQTIPHALDIFVREFSVAKHLFISSPLPVGLLGSASAVFSGPRLALGELVRLQFHNCDLHTARVCFVVEVLREAIPGEAVARVALVGRATERPSWEEPTRPSGGTGLHGEALVGSQYRDALKPCAVCGEPTGGCCPLKPDRSDFEAKDYWQDMVEQRASTIYCPEARAELDRQATRAHLERLASPSSAEDADEAWESPTDEWP